VSYLYLAIAILSEVIGTSALKATHEFTRFWPSVIVVLAYGSAFFFLTLALRTFPVGVAYAIWSGVGIVLVCLAGYVLYNQTLDLAAIVGMAFIVAGVVILNGFSDSVPH
jgi:small multidrug resistance pump